MTALPTPYFTVTAEEGRGWVRLRLTGDLDYDTSHELVVRAGDWLAVRPELSDLYLSCAELRLCDSMGVSALLQVHRDAAAQGVYLHVQDAPPFLDRIMRITGIQHLFASQEDRRNVGEATPSTEQRPSPSS
ncbi:STAS domain-containing protein [Streptomyces sp. NPDC089173]